MSACMAPKFEQFTYLKMYINLSRHVDECVYDHINSFWSGMDMSCNCLSAYDSGLTRTGTDHRTKPREDTYCSFGSIVN